MWDALQAIVAGQLRGDPDTITPSMSINALGINSLMAVEIALALQPYLKMRPYPTLLLEVSTLEELVGRLKSLQDMAGD